VPEGDTIHRAAAVLRSAIEGAVVTGFEAPRARGTAPPPEPGDRVVGVEARGKHLLIRFAGGATLHTHMRMSGVWRTFPADRWGRAGGRVVAVVRTERAVAVCFAAPVVELLDDHAVRRHPVLGALGPDLCLPDPDLNEIVRRSEALDPETEIGVALLDQRVATGIGNVYKSEVAFACRVDPFAPLAALDDDRRAQLWGTASELLRRNLGPSPRRTTPQGLAVYDRAGRPCLVCGTPIVVRRRGDAGRATWWCPSCQPRTPAARDATVPTETAG
jgi:endonuclease VIII